MKILLIGMMGSGKTSVGRLLADRLGRPFVDTDALIEAEAGRPVRELFAAEGEAGFRAREAEAVRAAVGAAQSADGPGVVAPGRVVATGGGAVLSPANRALLRAAGLVVWLDAPADELCRRLAARGLADRPLLAGGAGGSAGATRRAEPGAQAGTGVAPAERLRALAAEREPLYRDTAHVRVETAGRTTDEVALEVLRAVGAWPGPGAQVAGEAGPGPVAPPATADPPPDPGRRLRVDLGLRSYDIHIGAGLLDRIGPLVRAALPAVQRVLLISDTLVEPLYGDRVRHSLADAGITAATAVIPAGEGAKSIQQAELLWQACMAAGLERSSAIVALGGGVVGDLAGFVAATYLRGIPFVQAPTTLLAQVDASVGGKTGIDLPQGKNLVGAFHQPSLVVADVAALQTLPLREVRAGWAEVIKHAVIRDPDFFADLQTQGAALLDLPPAALADIVWRNCAIKAGVVAADEREQGLRAILNFGHTAGHALEAALGYGVWLHGEAVAVGMVAATALSRAAGVLADPALPERLERLLTQIGLPVRLPVGLDPASLLPLMDRDKKAEHGRLRWVLPVRPGEVKVTADLPPEAIRAALTAIV